MRSLVGRGVRHDLTGFETRLVLEQTIENVEGVSNRSGNNDGVEPGELVAGEVVVGDAPPRSTWGSVPR